MVDKRQLPTEVTGSSNWRMRAACRGITANDFFSSDNERRGPEKDARIKRAKKVCQDCPVITDCRRYALTAREPHGVWGGLTKSDRDKILLCMPIQVFPASDLR